MIYFSIDLEFWHSSQLLKEFNHKCISDHIFETVDFILENLHKTQNKATFFVLGEVCEKYPELIKKISQNRHEIGFHSYDHVLLNKKNHEDYYKECVDGKKKLESITGKKVYGHRAPAWSFTDWLPDVLERAGFLYDSSKNDIRIFSMAKQKSLPIKQYSVKNFGFGIFSIPFAGSIFFRIIPYFFLRLMIIYNEKKHGYVVLYTHPWEFFKPEWIKNKKLPLFFKFYNFSFLKHNRKKLKRLLGEFKTDSFFAI